MQRTAYEMRISDWSSDVCSSVLGAGPQRRGAAPLGRSALRRLTGVRPAEAERRRPGASVRLQQRLHRLRRSAVRLRQSRSEEHTSELQSLKRISYAVFCLKKKNNEHTINIDIKYVPSNHIHHY